MLALIDIDFENWCNTFKIGLIGCSQLESLNKDKPLGVCSIKNKDIELEQIFPPYSLSLK